jgi:RNA polymerase sigma factor (sigma-70 family)
MSMVGRGIVLRQIDRLFGEGTLSGLGDGPLLERYLTRRDEDAFEALVDRLGPMVLGLCRRMLRDPRDIEDAFQATFLVLVRKAPAIRDRDRLSSWLYGVAYRVARRARARTLRRRDREATVGVPEVAAKPAEPGRPEIDPMLDQEIRRLPERYREPLVLCYLRGRTHDQAAEDLRCPVGTVRSRMARGRALLKKRLTRRGFAPTVLAALSGGDVTLPARLLVSTVPPPMAAATVRAALGFGSSSILKAGAAAATSVVLAQGVLTTMKLAQLKWIGLVALATSLSASGVVAFAVSAEGQKSAQSPTPPSATLTTSVTSTTSTTETRLKALEDKIDQLMSRFTPGPDFDSRFAAMQGSEDGRQRFRSGQAPAATISSIGELEARLAMAIQEYRQTEKLVRSKAVSSVELKLYGGKAQVIAAQVEALEEQIQDELDRLALEKNRKVVQSEKAAAELEEANAVVARNRRLNARKPDMVAPEEVTVGESRWKAAAAESKIAKVEIAEVALRIRQLERSRDRIKEVSKLAKQVKELHP